MQLPAGMDELRTEDPEVFSVLESFAAIDRVYLDALRAMGAVPEAVETVSNSAEVTISFQQSS